MMQNEIMPAKEPIVLDEGTQFNMLRETNTGDRPVQVGPRYHFWWN